MHIKAATGFAISNLAGVAATMMKVLVLGLALVFLCSVRAEDDKNFAFDFLSRYNYISQTRSGNHDFTTAIKNFQKFFGLPLSGELDQATVALMRKPRCGMPDVDDSGLRVRRYNARDPWSKKSLTYYIEYGADLSASEQDEIFRLALKFWADESGLSFRQVKSGTAADIKISFGSRAHMGTHVESQCPFDFDGPGKVLAHAYFPSDGRAHFDEDETFTHGTSSGINLMWVAAHEFGHSLGLGHSNVQGALMYPYYTGYKPDMKLHADDIAGIQHLYGGPTGGGGGEVTDAPVVPPTANPNCRDRLDRPCAPYKDAGYCSTYPDNMKYWCARTCEFC